MKPKWKGGSMLAVLALAGAPAALAPSALAQEWTITPRATLAAGVIEEESPLASAGDVLADVGVVISREDTFENGLQLTWRLEGRYQRDAPSRPSFAGVLGNCPTSVAGCPRIASGGGFLSPVSPATGLAAFGQQADEDGFLALEGASVSLQGPWGQGVIGWDTGAAVQNDARAPQVLERVSAFSSSLDPTGLVTTRARNDVTGPSPKATYFSPRWLGLRAGVSFTPEANQRGVDFDPGYGVAGHARAELEDVWEGAISFARQFAQQDLRVRAAVTATRATSGSALVGFGDYEGWGAGLELEKAGWTGGLRWLSSDNAWAPGNGDYDAWEVGLVHETGDWRYGIEAGWSEDGLNRIKGASWLVGLSRRVGENLRLGVAWMDSEADLPVSLASALGHQNARNDGLVVELSVGNW